CTLLFPILSMNFPSFPKGVAKVSTFFIPAKKLYIFFIFLRKKGFVADMSINKQPPVQYAAL
ncbi:MAG: hypothetical protein MJY70_07650, partial [Bacteroidales bacterium]|nr:hypothetical protein [Bacteroidales bacterium]